MQLGFIFFFASLKQALYLVEYWVELVILYILVLFLTSGEIIQNITSKHNINYSFLFCFIFFGLFNALRVFSSIFYLAIFLWGIDVNFIKFLFCIIGMIIDFSLLFY